MISRNTVYTALLIFSIVNSACAGVSPKLNKENKIMPSIQSGIPANHDDDATNLMNECGSDGNLQQGNFTIYDYSVVIGMLVISLGIGVFYGFFQKSSTEASASEFLLGSQMPLFPVALSLTTSFITAIELLGNPSEMFYYGTQFALIIFSMILVIPVATKIFNPLYYKLNITSCYEYLGIRYGKELRVFGGVLYILQMCFYTAVAVLAPAIALSKATGLNTHAAVVLIYVVCIFYSSQGGMKAVVIADTFQRENVISGISQVVALGYFYTGDFSQVWQTASDDNRVELLNLSNDPTTRHSVFSIVIGGFFYWTSLLCCNQASVQKCMSLRSVTKANKALIFSLIGLIVVFLLNFYTGLMVYHHYENCDPLQEGATTARDQLLPFYIMDVFKDIPFMTGIFVAGIFAASLGTVAGALASLSAVTMEDILTAGCNIKIDPANGAKYGKWMSLGYGVISLALVFVVERLGGILQVTLTLNGLLGGVTLGLFTLGIFFRNTNKYGVLSGGVIALIFVIYVAVMAQVTGIEPEMLSTSVEHCPCMVNATRTMLIEVELIQQREIYETEVSALYKMSYMWYSLLGFALTTILSLLFSYVLSIANHLLNTGTETLPEITTKEANLTKISNIGNEKLEHQGIINQAFEKMDEV